MDAPHSRGADAWVPDVLGPSFEQLSLPLAPDDEGEVVATLVRPVAPPPLDRGIDVLYVHGWSDYFFQTALADFWQGLGARFHALDLRKYGRSMRAHQTPGYVTDLATYDEDIAAVLATLGPGRRLILMGHSTGGLILSLWADRHPGVAAAVVLNSPWLELQTRQAGRAVLTPFVGIDARLHPQRAYPQLDLGLYSRSVSASYDGEWTYDAAWRPDRGFPERPGWLNAIFQGHLAVSRGLHLDVPVLTLLSARSDLRPRWSSEMMHADTAIDVVGVAIRATQLGRLVTIVRLEGALHDVTLSARPVRDHAYQAMATWFDGYVLRPELAPTPAAVPPR